MSPCALASVCLRWSDCSGWPQPDLASVGPLLHVYGGLLWACLLTPAQSPPAQAIAGRSTLGSLESLPGGLELWGAASYMLLACRPWTQNSLPKGAEGVGALVAAALPPGPKPSSQWPGSALSPLRPHSIPQPQAAAAALPPGASLPPFQSPHSHTRRQWVRLLRRCFQEASLIAPPSARTPLQSPRAGHDASRAASVSALRTGPWPKAGRVRMEVWPF